MHAMTIAYLAVKFLMFNLVNVGSGWRLPRNVCPIVAGSVAGDCPPQFTDGGNVCYEVVEDMITGDDSLHICRKRNGRLARKEILEGSNMDSALEKVLDKGRRYFIRRSAKRISKDYPLGKASFEKTVPTTGTTGGNTTIGDVSTQKAPPKRKVRKARRKSPENEYVKLLCKSLYVKDPPVFKTRLPAVTVCTRECISHKNCTTVNFNTKTGECRGHSADSKTGMKDQGMWELWTVPVQ